MHRLLPDLLVQDNKHSKKLIHQYFYITINLISVIHTDVHSTSITGSTMSTACKVNINTENTAHVVLF